MINAQSSATLKGTTAFWRRKATFWAFLSLLGAMLAAAVYWLFNRPDVVQGIVIPESYDEWRAGAFESRVNQISAMTKHEDGIALYGDSLTEYGDWDRLLPELQIMNFGVRGDRTDGAYNRLKQLVSTKPKKVVLLIGTNDLEGGLRTPSDIADRFERILSSAIEQLPDTRFIVVSILPREPEYFRQVQDLRDLYRDVATKYSATYLDIAPQFMSDTGGLQDNLTTDGLHLSEAGYTQLARTLEPLLKRHGQEPASVESH